MKKTQKGLEPLIQTPVDLHKIWLGMADIEMHT